MKCSSAGQDEVGRADADDRLIFLCRFCVEQLGLDRETVPMDVREPPRRHCPGCERPYFRLRKVPFVEDHSYPDGEMVPSSKVRAAMTRYGITVVPRGTS